MLHQYQYNMYTARSSLRVQVRSQVGRCVKATAKFQVEWIRQLLLQAFKYIWKNLNVQFFQLMLSSPTVYQNPVNLTKSCTILLNYTRYSKRYGDLQAAIIKFTVFFPKL